MGRRSVAVAPLMEMRGPRSSWLADGEEQVPAGFESECLERVLKGVELAVQVADDEVAPACGIRAVPYGQRIRARVVVRSDRCCSRCPARGEATRAAPARARTGRSRPTEAAEGRSRRGSAGDGARRPASAGRLAAPTQAQTSRIPPQRPRAPRGHRIDVSANVHTFTLPRTSHRDPRRRHGATRFDTRTDGVERVATVTRRKPAGAG